MSRDLSSVRLARLHELMRLFHETPRPSRRHLLQRLGYQCDRTLERDLKLLREEFDAQIEYDPRYRTYSMKGRGRFLLRAELNDREVTLLAAGLGMAAHFLPHLARDGEVLWNKLKGLLPENLAAQGERLGRCAVVAQPVSALDPGVFEALLGAIANRQRVRFRYRSPYGDKAFREQHADPWGVFFRAHAWYLWGRTVAHGNESTWRVGRIRSLVPLGGEDYVPPPGDECLASLAASAWYAAPGEGRHPVSVRIRPPLASVVSETRWHPSQVLVQQDDGAVVLAARVPDLDEVARWVLASAPCAEVLEPSALADRVRELALEVAGIPEPAP
ncbi:helix-turn-helix transcriptional regulator [Aminomonas paucivorans]|uniref:helix-turn-helix transcriptional regulator n=1 Tax=Aminomonas paucivorans TaxID=81412 RepID=UPI00331A62EC